MGSLIICYFISSLHNSGGMERILTIKANYIADILGYDVVVVTNSQFDKRLFFSMSTNVTLVHLDLFEQPSKNIVLRRIESIKKLRKYKKEVRKLLFEIRPDVAISMCDQEFYFLTDINDGSTKFAEYHFSRFSQKIVWKNLTWYQKILGWYERRLFEAKISKYKKFIVLTEGDKKDWYEFDNVAVIPNPITVDVPKQADLRGNVVLAVGRYVHQKGFERLLKIWSKISANYPDWTLKIKGENPLHERYDRLIQEYNISHSVILENPSNDITDTYLKSAVFVMTSLYEGLPLSLIEAAAFGIPAISYDFKHGPADIIEHSYNGYLIENDNEEEFISCLKEMLGNREHLKEMGIHAKQKAQEFKEESIMLRWAALFSDNQT